MLPALLNRDGWAQRHFYDHRLHDCGLILDGSSLPEMIEIDFVKVNRVAPFHYSIVAQIVFICEWNRHQKHSATRAIAHLSNAHALTIWKVIGCLDR